MAAATVQADVVIEKERHQGFALTSINCTSYSICMLWSDGQYQEGCSSHWQLSHPYAC